MTFQKKSQLLEVIQEYKSDNAALKEQITELQKQLSSAEARIKQLLIKYEHSVQDNSKQQEEE
jgi:septal ring factor EnvC (AmiA/AmiB activator)